MSYTSSDIRIFLISDVFGDQFGNVLYGHGGFGFGKRLFTQGTGCHQHIGTIGQISIQCIAAELGSLQGCDVVVG